MNWTDQELVWESRGVDDDDTWDLRTVTGVLLGSVRPLGGSWVCELLGSVIATRPDETAARAVVIHSLKALGRLTPSDPPTDLDRKRRLIRDKLAADGVSEAFITFTLGNIANDHTADGILKVLEIDFDQSPAASGSPGTDQS